MLPSRPSLWGQASEAGSAEEQSTLWIYQFRVNRIDLCSTQAAPRIELGIKDLQSSALPLGHATINFLKRFCSVKQILTELAAFILSFVAQLC
jgi:hypothetical protein